MAGSDIEDGVLSKGPDIEDRLHFPKWYWLTTRWLPLSIAVVLGAVTLLTLMGYIALPAALGIGLLEWAPAYFATLQGFTSFAALSVTVAAVSSAAYITTLLFSRALTSHIPEEIAINNQREYALIERKLMSKKVKLEGLEEKHHHEMLAYDQQVQRVTTKYDRLRGMHDVREDSEPPVKPKPARKRIDSWEEPAPRVKKPDHPVSKLTDLKTRSKPKVVELKKQDEIKKPEENKPDNITKKKSIRKP